MADSTRGRNTHRTTIVWHEDLYWYQPNPACPHGTWSGYSYWCCKCPPCCDAGKAHFRERNIRRARGWRAQ